MPELSHTFYDAIAKNRWRTAFLFALFPAMMLTIVYLGSLITTLYASNLPVDQAFVAAGDLFFQFTPWVIVGSAVWILLMMLGGKNMVLSMAGAKLISKAEAPDLYRMVENLAIRTGMPTPQVYIIEDESMNAFATGFSPQSAVVAVTRGILRQLDKDELEAVLAHEFGHIICRDTRTMLIAITMVGVLQLLADMILRSMWYAGRSKRSNEKNGAGGIIMLAAIAIWLIGFVGSVLVQLGISRRREFNADAQSAQLTRNPAGLISALQKISTDARVEVLDGKRSIAMLCIADPLEGEKHSFLETIQSLFRTHPSTKRRIEELRGMGG